VLEPREFGFAMTLHPHFNTPTRTQHAPKTHTHCMYIFALPRRHIALLHDFLHTSFRTLRDAPHAHFNTRHLHTVMDRCRCGPHVPGGRYCGVLSRTQRFVAKSVTAARNSICCLRTGFDVSEALLRLKTISLAVKKITAVWICIQDNDARV
jgi:hypothetical protein